MQELLDTISNSLSHIENKPFQGYYFWLEEFVRTVKPRLVVELGTWEGGSTLHLLKGLPEDSKLITVDITLRHGLLANIVDERLRVIIGEDTADEVWAQIPANIDMLFIDTHHDITQFSREIDRYSQKFAPLCYVFLDDIHLESMEAVWSSIDKPKYDLSEWHGSGFGLVIYS